MQNEDLIHRLAAALADQPRASMEQLAHTVGISRTTLCRKFATRDDMLTSLAEQAVLECVAALESSNIEDGAAEEVISRIVTNMLPSVELYRVLESPEYEDFPVLKAWGCHKQKLRELHERWQARGELRVDLPANWIWQSMFLLMRGAASMVRDGQLARADAVNAVCTLLLEGVRPPAQV